MYVLKCNHSVFVVILCGQCNLNWAYSCVCIYIYTQSHIYVSIHMHIYIYAQEHRASCI